ncbi:hypothetical protein M885DRAFT_519544, partial [Pelagophyceae sp. CCMP2097]
APLKPPRRVPCKRLGDPRAHPRARPRDRPGDIAEGLQSRGRWLSDRPRDCRETVVKATVTEGPSRDPQKNCPKELSKGQPKRPSEPLEGPSQGAVS